MGSFGLLKANDINAGVQRFRETADAVLLDVRNWQEYAAGHIPGSLNLPMDKLEDAEDYIPSKNVPVFVYCLSGGRSARALAILNEMGYDQVANLGGIGAYKGELERERSSSASRCISIT